MSGKDLIKTLYLRNLVTRPYTIFMVLAVKEAAQKARNMQLNIILAHQSPEGTSRE